MAEFNEIDVAPFTIPKDEIDGMEEEKLKETYQTLVQQYNSKSGDSADLVTAQCNPLNDFYVEFAGNANTTLSNIAVATFHLLDDANESIGTLEGEVRQLTGKNKELEAEKSATNAAHAAKVTELDRTQAEEKSAQQQEINDLRAQLEAKEKSLSGVQAGLDSLQSQFDAQKLLVTKPKILSLLSPHQPRTRKAQTESNETETTVSQKPQQVPPQAPQTTQEPPGVFQNLKSAFVDTLNQISPAGSGRDEDDEVDGYATAEEEEEEDDTGGGSRRKKVKKTRKRAKRARRKTRKFAKPLQPIPAFLPM
jgi:hypothetical protein